MPHKKGSKKRTLRNKPKKGGFYSFAGAVGTGAPLYVQKTEMQDPTVGTRGGNSQYFVGGKRKGKGKKTRKMKGGQAFGAVSASYQGTGARGFADYVGVSPNKPGFATEGQFNNYGAQPGSGHGSFITAGK